ncbi:uncharacterized protein LOC129730154 [Wyeomyia smithii]|uniref:uncharacterized protein LOC129730154 n=1 Tax=Wyeomyia smithii TaxID=174621 RepID=UPI002468042A|nr:uncharacterized protein LOC129730154 [Wyeomyia smithii]
MTWSFYFCVFVAVLQIMFVKSDDGEDVSEIKQPSGFAVMWTDSDQQDISILRMIQAWTQYRNELTDSAIPLLQSLVNEQRSRSLVLFEIRFPDRKFLWTFNEFYVSFTYLLIAVVLVMCIILVCGLKPPKRLEVESKTTIEV